VSSVFEFRNPQFLPPAPLPPEEGERRRKIGQFFRPFPFPIRITPSRKPNRSPAEKISPACGRKRAQPGVSGLTGFFGDLRSEIWHFHCVLGSAPVSGAVFGFSPNILRSASLKLEARFLLVIGSLVILLSLVIH
jgi:hypothetical protein